MTKGKGITVIVVATWLLVSMMASAWAEEPSRPVVNQVFDAAKETMIQELAGLPLADAMAWLKEPAFFINEPVLHKAIYTAFKNRKSEAVNYAVLRLRLPITEIMDGKTLSRGRDFHLAKKILHVFPEDATDALIQLYGRGDNITKGNILRVCGNLAGGDAIRNLLVAALDDDTFSMDEEEPDEMSGEPLRICDIAYNQLVLRYKIKDVLRTIGPVHRLSARDYHINILKSRL